MLTVRTLLGTVFQAEYVQEGVEVQCLKRYGADNRRGWLQGRADCPGIASITNMLNSAVISMQA